MSKTETPYLPYRTRGMVSHDITFRPYNIITMSLAISMRSLAYRTSLSLRMTIDDDNLTSMSCLSSQLIH